MSKVIFISGISSGFGQATARLLASAGHKVYGTMRSVAPSDAGVTVLKMDLTDHQSIKNAVSEVFSREGKIDVLINNGGMHTGGPLETTPWEHAALQVNTNFMGMAFLTREVLPLMRQNGGGTIINFSSIGGLMGLPFQGFYSAGKFAIEGFSEALRMEVRKFNIKVVLINPGDFHTNNSANRRNFLTAEKPGDPYFEQFKTSLAVIEKDEGNGWEPEVLARKLCRIVESNNPAHRYIIASFEQKLAVMLKYVLPSKMFMKILADHYKV
ncbi:MAG TPA: SDR family oxidoreductase [Bacteroidales bacterium]|nr:SDR family oxidoreductase [Bacteroidales bacterium]